MTLPQHTVSAWMGHSETVSRRHYLQIPDELLEKAAGQGAAKSAAKCAAVDSRTPSQDVANGGSDSEDAKRLSQKESQKTLQNKWFTGSFATSGGRTRTADLGIMKPTL